MIMPINVKEFINHGELAISVRAKTRPHFCGPQNTHSPQRWSASFWSGKWPLASPQITGGLRRDMSRCHRSWMEWNIPAQERVVHIFTSSTIIAKRCDKSPINRNMFIFANILLYLTIKTKLKNNTETLTHPLDVACAVACGNRCPSIRLVSKRSAQLSGFNRPKE